MPLSKRPTPTVAGSVSVAAALLLAGCLPSSCQRSESTQLLPADSLSRRMAASAPTDTLRVAWTTLGEDPHRFAYPRTVRFGQGDTLYVGDVQRNSLFVVVAPGEISAEIELPGVTVPYLAGPAGDMVFSPVSTTFYQLDHGHVVDSIAIEDPGRESSSLVYGAAGANLYYKRVDPEKNGFIAAYTRDGALLDTTHLEGPHWRYAGLLKMWGDTLASLSGFRPVVDLVAPAPGGSQDPASATGRDTLALAGFDSPMLARSRSFMRGDVHEAPLLSSSAAPAGDRLFVLNMRAGWLQVDVFGRDGVLLYRLVEPDVTYQSSFFPQDIDVRRSEGGYEIAVVYSEPEPALRLFLWATTVSSSAPIPIDETADTTRAP